jgi:hypothetical protein
MHGSNARLRPCGTATSIGSTEKEGVLRFARKSVASQAGETIVAAMPVVIPPSDSMPERAVRSKVLTDPLSNRYRSYALHRLDLTAAVQSLQYLLPYDPSNWSPIEATLYAGAIVRLVKCCDNGSDGRRSAMDKAKVFQGEPEMRKVFSHLEKTRNRSIAHDADYLSIALPVAFLDEAGGLVDVGWTISWGVPTRESLISHVRVAEFAVRFAGLECRRIYNILRTQVAEMSPDELSKLLEPQFVFTDYAVSKRPSVAKKSQNEPCRSVWRTGAG